MFVQNRLTLWVRILLRRSVIDMLSYVMKFVSDMRQVGSFSRALRFPPPTDGHDITEILLKHHKPNPHAEQ